MAEGSPKPWDQRLTAHLEARRAQSTYRQRRTLDSAQGREVIYQGHPYVNFASNDYLGLAADPRLIEAQRSAVKQWGVGAGSAHLVCGHQSPHQALEEALARLTGRSAALLFSTGYMANLGVIQALTRRGDEVIQDRLNHASLLDGAQLSGARLKRYRHQDIRSLNQHLNAPCQGLKLVVSDGVFSMDGDCADIPALAAQCQAHQALLMVDDAHGLGVLGSHGGGLCQDEDLETVPILVGTLGKALGTAGAFVAGSHALIDYLTNFARTAIYTTAQPPAVAATTLKALELVQQEPERRQHLQQLIHDFREGAQALGLPLLPSQTPIQPLALASSAQALHWQARLAQAGLWVSAIRPPTVPSPRLRITLTAAHRTSDIDRLLNALAQCLTEHGSLESAMTGPQQPVTSSC